MNAPPGTAQPIRGRGVAAIAGMLMLVVLVLAAGFSRLERSPGWVGPVVVAMFVAFTAIVLRITGSANRVVAWVAVVGAGIALLGSGLTRSRLELQSSGSGSGTIHGRLDTWWLLLFAGIGVAVFGVVVASSRRRAAPDLGRAAALAMLSLSIGTLVVVLLMRDIVVGQWIEGRPVRRRGRLVLPPPRSTSGDPARDAWLIAADHEEAAITAFTNLAHRLHAVGAPRELVERSRDAAVDEERHARQCRRLAGCDAQWTPRATAPPAPPRVRSRRVELTRIALESLADGAVNEGVAAEHLERRAAGADADTARGLRAMARDERRHAELALDIVEWCRCNSGFLLDAALLATKRRLAVDSVLRPQRCGAAASTASVKFSPMTSKE